MTLFDLAPVSRDDVGPRTDEQANERAAALKDNQADCRIVLGLSYDGSAFHGFAPQARQKTVAGALLDALARRFSSELSLTCAGRTDTGVHALTQVVHLDVTEEELLRSGESHLEPGRELAGLARSLTTQLRPHIVVYKAAVAPPGFDARRSALARRYRYDLETSARIDPLRAKGVWHIGEELDLAAMRVATDPLLGEHDFSGFCRRPDGQEPGPLKRRVLGARWLEMETGWLRFEIEAKAFCHQMVRSIVGTLVEVGQHRRSPAEMMARLRSGSRQGAAKLAPPNGLCLVGVRYPEELGGQWS